MFYFRDADQDTLYESVRGGRPVVEDAGLYARKVFAGDHSHLTDPERIRRAGSTLELAMVMNDICPHLAAVKDVFRLNARGPLGPFADIYVWGGFESTIDEPPTTKPLRQDATNYALLRLLDRLESAPRQPGEDKFAKARPFLQAHFKTDEVAGIEADIAGLAECRRLGRMDVFGARLVQDHGHAVVLQEILELANGMDGRIEASLPTTMPAYAVPLGHAMDKIGAERAEKSMTLQFQAKLKPVIAAGDIGNTHRMAYDGSRMRFTFNATRSGAQLAADRLAPLKVIDENGGDMLRPAAILVC